MQRNDYLEILKSELSSLEEIYNHYSKVILIMDVDPEVNYNGIKNVLYYIMARFI